MLGIQFGRNPSGHIKLYSDLSSVNRFILIFFNPAAAKSETEEVNQIIVSLPALSIALMN